MTFYYPENLPVVSRKDDIIDGLKKNQIIVIAGDTGSGKTTQIPKICLETFGVDKAVIGCTQPRRIAATSVAARVADELGESGYVVGYKIRFHDHTSKNTRIKFMTDGVLLAETRSDPLLKNYNVIILDEAHERSLNIDFLLGYFKDLLARRPDLKLVVTSATIDTAAFAKHFGDAPIINISGRTYPVEVRYRPHDNDDITDAESYVEHCAEEIARLNSTEPPGDILAFLPTEKDIRNCCELLSGKIKNGVILPMFGRLQSSDQKKIFQSYHQPKIVVATNVAETSITVPGIRYVVDTGLARMSFYNARAKTTSLPVTRVSQASCDQRKGRCGRVGPGLCVRLYPEEDYHNRDEFTTPEIKRSNLAEVILQMISFKLGDPNDFPFIDPPRKNAVRDGYKLLFELGALTASNKLTKAGRFMSRLPIDPCISRILLEAKQENCLREVTIIASALAIMDPRMRPAAKEKEADAAHVQFAHPHSDFMALLNIWNSFHEFQGSARSWSKLRKFSKAHYLSFQRMREWLDLHEQLLRILQRLEGFELNSQDADYQKIHRSLAAGFLRNIAVKKQGKVYQGPGNQELMIFPGSHQFLTGGRWIIAASFLETNRLYALTVATIEPEWLEPLASHLVKYSWSSPRWNKKSGQVIADEKVSLFGLILVASRKVNFPKRSEKNIPEAQDIFIQSALIENNLQGNYPFLDHNTSLIAKWKKEEDKLRSTVLVNEDALFFSFYKERLPETVYDRSSLNKYLRKSGHKRLRMTESDILKQKPDENTLANFPSTIETGNLSLQLVYDFSPGKETDGITIRIPLSVAPTLTPSFFAWLVPGLLKEKVTILVKGLPKSLRKHLVPVNVAVDRILDDINIYKGSLHNSLESSIHKLYRIQIQRSDWPTELPQHLQPRFLLFDGQGREVCSGRDLHKLLRETSGSTETFHEQLHKSQKEPGDVTKWKNLESRQWAFSGLPDSIAIITPHKDIGGFYYPVLLPQVNKGNVILQFVTDKKESVQKNLIGVEFLYRLHFSDGYKSLKKYCSSLLSGPSSLFFLGSSVKGNEAVERFLTFLLRSLIPSIDGTIPDEETFHRDVAALKKEGFYRAGKRVADETIKVVRKRAEVTKQLNHFIHLDTRRLVFSNEKIKQFEEMIDDIIGPAYFLTRKQPDLADSMRQLQSLEKRIERYYANPAKDEEKMKNLRPHIDFYSRLNYRRQELSEEALELLLHYRKMIDEFRISLFSPEIKTRISVSAKKLKQFQIDLKSKC